MQLKKSIIILFVFNNMITSLNAQQELQMSTYFFNQLYINPAYAGSQKSLVVNATIRDQWTNFKGACMLNTCDFGAPLKFVH